MPKEIEAHRLGDLVKITSGGTPSKEIKANWGGDMPWISASSMKQKSLNDSALKLTEQGINSGGRIAEPGDVLLLVRGSELHNSIPVGIATRRVTYNQDIKSLRCGDKISSEFLYYWLKAMETNLLSKVESTGIGAGKIDTEILKGLEILLPEKDEQNAVAKQFKALDDKIELNGKMNETLEQIAWALFKSWFVDFDPVHAKAAGRQPASMDKATADLFPDSFVDSEIGKIPKGWKIVPVGEVVECVGGATPSTAETKYWKEGRHHWTTPKDFSALASPFLLDTERKLTDAGISKISSGLLPAGTLLLSSRAPIGYIAIATIPVAINQGFIALKCNEIASNFFMLNWCKANMAEIEGRATGTTFPEISKQNFRPISVCLPPKELMSAFTAKVSPIYGKIVANLRQSRNLSAIRDTLLPGLLNGDIITSTKP